MARKMSKISKGEMEGLDAEVFLVFQSYTKDSDGISEAALLEFAAKFNLIAGPLTKSEVSLIFSRTKLGKQKVLKIDRFQEAIRSMAVAKGITYQMLIETHIAGGAGGAGAAGQLNLPGNTNTKVSIDDFDLLKVLGKGSFGKVMLVRHTETSQIYALKVSRVGAHSWIWLTCIRILASSPCARLR
jgi:hypothetical protein